MADFFFVFIVEVKKLTERKVPAACEFRSILVEGGREEPTAFHSPLHQDQGAVKAVACSNARVLMLDPGAQPRSPGLLRGNQAALSLYADLVPRDSSHGPLR